MTNRGIPTWYKESDMLYKYVIDTVMEDCREYFLDEGLSEDVLLDLKTTWEQHVEHSQVTANYPPPRPKAAHHSASSLHAYIGQEIVVPPSVPQTAVKEEEGGNGDAPTGEGGDGEENRADEEVTSEDDEPLAQDPAVLFDTDNTLVCQYEKIVKTKNKWKVFLKSGIMTVNEKDYVFQKCSGEATW